MKDFLGHLVKNNFPAHRIKYAFGYGSSVFKQANYHIDDVIIYSRLNSLERSSY
jgi:hypothetical protein